MTQRRNNMPRETQTEAVGVVFSSGFFGFFAHAGFLAAIRELEMTPVAYAGSSSGAIVAAMAASWMNDGVIRDMLFGLKKADFCDLFALLPAPDAELLTKHSSVDRLSIDLSGGSATLLLNDKCRQSLH